MSENAQKTPSPGPLQRFFWGASGATSSILVHCPTDQKFYSTVGAVMLLIAALAGVSAGFTVHQTFGSLPVAVGAGLFWSALIYTVERIVQVSIRKDGDKKRQSLWLGALRFAQIAVVSFLITDPLLHTFFEKEIEYQLKTETQQAETTAKDRAQARTQDEVTQLQSEIDNLRAEVKSKETKRDEKFNELMAEGRGTGGTMVPGRGDFYREKETAHRQAEQEYKDARARAEKEIEQKSARQEELKKRVEAEMADIRDAKEKAKGWLARNSALFKIMKQDFGAAFFAVLLMLAFILIESIPMFAKLFTESGAYDARLSRVEKELMLAEKEELVEAEKRIKMLSLDRLDNERRVSSLKKKTIEKVVGAIENDQRQSLNAAESELADAVWAHVESEILDEYHRERKGLAAGRPSPAADATKPTPLLVRVLEPEETTFKVNFNVPEPSVVGSDLLYSLRGIEDDLLFRNDKTPPLSAYRAVNDLGIEIEPGRPLFAQLNGSRAVNLVLSPQAVSEAEH